MKRSSFLLMAAVLSTIAAQSAGEGKKTTRECEPLKTAWKDLVATGDRATEIESMTSVQRYDLQMKAVAAAQKSVRSKTFGVRLVVTGVIEPTQQDRLMLVHGQYADEEYRKIFGDQATIGIWTSDYKTALELKNGEIFELRGKIFYEVHYLANDIARVPSLWQQKAINTSVAFLDHHITKWVRPARIYMVNPVIVRNSSDQ